MRQHIAQARPVIVVAVYQQVSVRPLQQVTHAPQRQWIYALWLLIQRDEESLAIEGIADRDGMRAPIGVGGGEAGDALRLDERADARREDERDAHRGAPWSETCRATTG